jgi:hypothetical protein
MYKNWSFDQYRKEVDKFTQTKRRTVICRIGEEVDHRLQVKVAYKIGIEPRVVAEPINLRPLAKEFNAARQDILDNETISAIRDLANHGFVAEEMVPHEYKKVEFGELSEVVEAVKNLSAKKPHAQVYVPVGALASIEPIENQRNHEARYPKQLHHFEQIGTIRPKHTKFTVTVFEENSKFAYRLTDGNTRKHNILNGYIQLLGLEFPDKIAVDLEWACDKEQAAEDSLLHDAGPASKNTTDLVNGIRRQIGMNDGILIDKINDGDGILPISFAISYGTPHGMRAKNDWMNSGPAISFAYPIMQTVINEYICKGEPKVNRPRGMVDWHIASLCRMYIKYGENAVDTITDFVDLLSSREFGDRTSSKVYRKRLQPLEVILDELTKYSEADESAVQYYKETSITGETPRQVMPNSNSDGNIKIYMGLTLYALEASMQGRMIKENLYEEFCENVKNKSKEVLRSQAINKVEQYFDGFWVNEVNAKAP